MLCQNLETHGPRRLDLEWPPDPGREMTSPEDTSGLFVEDLYLRSYDDLNQLQKQLPQDVVASLAREVLEGLARKMAQPQAHSDAIMDLAKALIGPEPKAAATLIEKHYQNGADVNALYLDYLAPAALQLGKWWESDEVPFSSVTTGIGRIYAIMRLFRPRIRPSGKLDKKSAFFASVPDDDHTLGVNIAAELARKAGWHIEVEMDSEHDRLVERIVTSGHRLIGLSAAGKHSVPDLTRLVLALRINLPDALIMISGNVVEAAADSLKLMHLDGAASDYETAMQELDRLWATLQRTST